MPLKVEVQVFFELVNKKYKLKYTEESCRNVLFFFSNCFCIHQPPPPYAVTF